MSDRIQRYSCVPHGITRRGFGATVGGALLGTTAQKSARAADPAVTVVIVPDAQFLNQSGACAGATIYNAMIQWAIDNRNLSVNGTPLNIKGFVQVGDCADITSATGLLAGETIMADAYDLAYAANMFVAHCPGNHDYQGNGGSGTRENIGHAWKPGGRWSPANLAAKYGSGLDLTGGDSAVWGGTYTDPTYSQSSANNYIRVRLGSRKILIVATEFFPRASVLSWVEGLHNTYADHELWMTTHSYLTAANKLVTRGTGNNVTNMFGPDAYVMCSSYPSSTTGTEQWTVMKTLARSSLITCGHWLDGYDFTGVGGWWNPANWVWQKTSTNNDAGRSVHQIFCNCQERDAAAPCSGPTADIAHLMLLRIWPTTCEAFLVSTTAGTWTGAQGVTGRSSPIQLFSVPFAPVATGLWALPSPRRR